MHSKAGSHHSFFGMSWSAVNVTLSLMIALLFLVFLLLFLFITTQPAQA